MPLAASGSCCMRSGECSGLTIYFGYARRHTTARFAALLAGDDGA